MSENDKESNESNSSTNEENSNNTNTKYKFKAETRKLLDILSKSLYKHKDIFLRELISNSADALKKIEYIALTEDKITSPDLEYEINVFFDQEEQTITVQDTGIGMNQDDLIANLGTIAGSGSEKFLKQLIETQQDDKELDMDIIGQFGVGFYSVFMVAEKARIITKHYKSDVPAYEWISDGSDEFIVKEASKEERGTTVILYLSDDETEYLNQQRLESIVKKYSNFVSYPIYVTEIGVEEDDAEAEDDVQEVDISEEDEESSEDTAEEEKEGEKDKDEEEREPVNQIQPIWKRNPSDVEEEDYKNFYNYLTRRYEDYREVIHYNVDGRVQFRSIFYIPESKSQDILQPETEYGPALYSKNVLIMDHCKELVPQWMRFVKGVVDSQDIPLNVSRDTIQSNRIIMKMESLLTKKFIRELKKMSRKDQDKYREFWKEFGFFVKEGIVTDRGRQTKLLKLLRFKTSKTKGDELIGLDDYVERMKDGQEEIYYLVGDNIDVLRVSPHLGYYQKNDLEVILFDEPVDNFLMMNVPGYEITVEKEVPEEFKDKGELEKEEKMLPFKPIDVTEAKAKEEGEEGGEETEDEDMPEATKIFLDKVKSVLGERIMDAQMTDKLYGNACRLANPEGGMTSSMQRAMRFWTMGAGDQSFQIPKKILEFNEDHPIVKTLIEIVEQNPDSGKIAPIVNQLFENCLLAEGDLPDPSKMVPRINQIIEILLTGKDTAENPLESTETPEDDSDDESIEETPKNQSDTTAEDDNTSPENVE